MSYEKRVRELGIGIPVPPRPAASYLPGVIVDGLLYVSGQLPVKDGELQVRGVVDSEVSVDEAYQAARLCALNALGVVRMVAGSLDAVEKIVKLEGFVNSTSQLTAQPQCINGASDLLVEIFGEAGAHARFAIGTAGLPLGAPVEVGMVVKLK